MPLSEHEQKLLEQMERALYAEDPKFASQMRGRGSSGGPDKTRLAAGLLVAAFGLVCIVAGVSLKLIWLGGAGFALMVAGAAWAFTPPRGVGAGRLTDTTTGASRRSGSKTRRSGRTGSGSFMQRMENRWDQRRSDGF